MTNEDIKKLADELSFNVGWENIRVLVTIPYELFDKGEVVLDKAVFKDQILDWLKGNGTEPSILACTGVKVELFGISDIPPHVVRSLGCFTMTKQERIDGFLAGYEALCKQFQVRIGGCVNATCLRFFLQPVWFHPELVELKGYIESLRQETPLHTTMISWERHNPDVSETTDGPELPNPQVQNDQIPPS